MDANKKTALAIAIAGLCTFKEVMLGSERMPTYLFNELKAAALAAMLTSDNEKAAEEMMDLIRKAGI